MTNIFASNVSGLLSEIASQSVHDQPLTCNPQMTFFSQNFSRYTNFAIGEQDISFQNAPSGIWSAQSNVRAELQRSGDLLLNLYFLCRLRGLPVPTATGEVLHLNIWTPAVAYAILQRARLRIGSQQVEELHDTYMMMLDEVHTPEGKRQGLDIGDYGKYLRSGFANDSANGNVNPHQGDEETWQAAIEYSTRNQHIHAELPFHFANCPELALNLVGMQKHTVEVELDIRGYSDVVIEGDLSRVDGSFTAGDTGPALTGTQGQMDEARLRMVVAHLDKAERKVRAQQPANYIYVFPQNQVVTITAADHGTQKEIRNYFNQPVVDLLWAYRSSDFDTTFYKQFFAFGGLAGDKALVNDPSGGATAQIHYAPQEVLDGITHMELVVNNHTRFSGRSEYFTRSVPRARSARIPGRIIGQYSFALDPSNKCKPSGSFNFSRIDNVLIKPTFRSLSTTTESRETIDVYEGQVIAAHTSTNASLTATFSLHGRTIGQATQAFGMWAMKHAN